MFATDHTVFEGEFDIDGQKMPWKKGLGSDYILIVGPMDVIPFNGILSLDRAKDLLTGFKAGVPIGERRGISRLQDAFKNLMHL